MPRKETPMEALATYRNTLPRPRVAGVPARPALHDVNAARGA